MKRLDSAKRALIISLISHGTPINAVCRILHVGKHAVLRVIEETGEAMADYMDKNFRNLTVDRLALDEAWSYVGQHGLRMKKAEAGRGDFWLWAGIDSDTKFVVGFLVGRQDWNASEDFVRDIASRIDGHVQIATDAHRSYVNHIEAHFGARGSFSYAIETKIFSAPFSPEEFPKTRRNGIPKIVTAKRKSVFGNPDLRTTTCHIERLFLTVRQELKRYQRLGLGYSKKLSMHLVATALQIGIYNLCRKHVSLEGKTPAQAAGVEKDHRKPGARRWGHGCLLGGEIRGAEGSTGRSEEDAGGCAV